MLAFVRKHKTAFLLSLLYFVPGMVWVFFSDQWIYGESMASATEEVLRIDTIKDASFVLAVSVLLFFMIHLSRRKLIDTRLQYQNVFEQHPQPLWVYEIATKKFVAVNNAALVRYGYTRDEFLSLTLADIRPAEDVPVLEKFLSEYRTAGTHQSVWTHLTKSGERLIVELVANNITFFGKQCRMISVTDITEKVKKEAEVQRLSLVAKNATNSVIITDKDAKIEWVNEAFSSLTGYTLEEVVGRRPSDFLHGPETDEKTRDEIFTCLKERKPYSGEILNYRKDGSTFWLRLTVSPVIAGGILTNFVTVQTDITAIKEQNNRLRDIAFTASHGFRKPLANIIGLLPFVGEQTDPQIVRDLKQSAAELDEEVRVIVQKAGLVN